MEGIKLSMAKTHHDPDRNNLYGIFCFRFILWLVRGAGMSAVP